MKSDKVNLDIQKIYSENLRMLNFDVLLTVHLGIILTLRTRSM